MAADSLAVDSFALAALLADAVSSTADVCGVLLGSVRVQRSARVTDATDRPTEVEASVSLLRGHVCAASALPFFDAAGRLDEEALASLLRATDGAPMLGWFVARRASPLTPSMRETEVWKQLQRRATHLKLPPPLFALVCSDHPTDGQPFSTQYVFLAPQPDAPQQPPTALPVAVLNVGAARRAPEASALSAGWHPLLDSGAAGTDATAPWRALEASAAQGAEQTRGAFEAALQRATALCLEVEAADDALHASRERARLSAAALDEELAKETLSDDDALLTAGAVELRDSDAQPTAYEPPPVLLADAAAPSILDEILADERSGTQTAALQY